MVRAVINVSDVIKFLNYVVAISAKHIFFCETFLLFMNCRAKKFILPFLVYFGI